MGRDLTKDYEGLRELVNSAASDMGISSEELIFRVEKERERVAQLRKSCSGKYKVIGVDKFSNEDWEWGEYDTPEEALFEAQKKTIEGMGSASDRSVATIYYAYNPEGEYIGGDIWVGE